MAEIRLQKYFTDCGVMSRRAAEAEIAAGKVKVNGEVAEVGRKIDPERDTVEYKGKVIKRTGDMEYTYILLNKPVGYVCTLSDEADRLTVADLIKNVKSRVYPVGRLDMYSDGLLLITDDGELTCRLTHPSHGFTKTYVAEIPAVLTEDDVYRIGAPVEIDGRLTRRAETKLVSVVEGKSYVEILLKEGRNRQIRRMCESAGFKLTRLTRTKIGDIELTESLPRGKWRYLTADEINYLKGI